MRYNEYKIETVVWQYPGMAGWHFVTIPEDISEDIKTQFGDLQRGWGSLPIKARIEKTTWETSLFPDKKLGGYLLPLKAAVRKKENISADDKIVVILEVKR